MQISKILQSIKYDGEKKGKNILHSIKLILHFQQSNRSITKNERITLLIKRKSNVVKISGLKIL